MNAMDSADAEVLQQLEESMWRSHTRFDPGYMDRVLHREFFEFGRSGRRWTRAETLIADPAPIDAEIHDLAVHGLGPGVAMVTYVSVVRAGSVYVSNRSSLWVRDGGGGWLLRFHQGTPAPS